MFQHIALVALVVRDYDEAIEFYVDRLGFELVEDTPLGDYKRWVVVRPPGQPQTALLLAKAAETAKSPQSGRRLVGECSCSCTLTISQETTRLMSDAVWSSRRRRDTRPMVSWPYSETYTGTVGI